MNSDIYKSIAELIVRANELRKAEERSANADLEDFVYETEDESAMTHDGIVGAKDYSAYLNRKASAKDISEDMAEYAGHIKKQSELSSSMSDAAYLAGKEKAALQNALEKEQWEYIRYRDDVNDSFYEMKESIKNKGGSSSGNSSSKKQTEKEEETLSGSYYVDRMPAFCKGTSVKDRMNNEVYSKKFREKVLQISSGGTEKAEINELNALVKMAEKYGASDAYIKWIHNVCGYG